MTKTEILEKLKTDLEVRGRKSFKEVDNISIVNFA